MWRLAPASVTPQRLAALKDLGVTRISMGVQSFQPVLLEALGRRHTREQVLRAYDRVRGAGFASVNLDLIFAVPGQSLAAWRADLDAAVELQPDHISTYCLTFEEDTALFVKLAQGRVRPDVGEEAAFYTEAWERLEGGGLCAVRDLELRAGRPPVPPQSEYLAHGGMGRARAVGGVAIRRLAELQCGRSGPVAGRYRRRAGAR